MAISNINRWLSAFGFRPAQAYSALKGLSRYWSDYQRIKTLNSLSGNGWDIKPSYPCLTDFRDQGEEAVVAVQLLVQAAVVLRRAAFRRCRYCGQNTPPEWWHGEDACQGCAERHLGVVH